MTDRRYYKHAITGAVSLYPVGFARVFGDRLVEVDGPEAESSTSTSPKKRSARKTSEDATTTDSSKEGND